jgi:putative transposase
VHEINGISDPMHRVVSIPPSIRISKFIGQIKAVASLRINQSGILGENFYWQTAYSRFSFRESELPAIIQYVKNQKTNHKKGTVKETMEII